MEKIVYDNEEDYNNRFKRVLTREEIDLLYNDGERLNRTSEVQKR